MWGVRFCSAMGGGSYRRGCPGARPRQDAGKPRARRRSAMTSPGRSSICRLAVAKSGIAAGAEPRGRSMSAGRRSWWQLGLGQRAQEGALVVAGGEVEQRARHGGGREPALVVMSSARRRPLSCRLTPARAARRCGTANCIAEGGVAMRRQRQAAVPWLSRAPSPAANSAAVMRASSSGSSDATAAYTPACMRCTRATVTRDRSLAITRTAGDRRRFPTVIRRQFEHDAIVGARRVPKHTRSCRQSANTTPTRG